MEGKFVRTEEDEIPVSSGAFKSQIKFGGVKSQSKKQLLNQPIEGNPSTPSKIATKKKQKP